MRSIAPETGIYLVCEDALELSRQLNQFDELQMQEAIQHVDDRRHLLTELRRGLRRGRKILLIRVPPKVQYPLFRAALEC